MNKTFIVAEAGNNHEGKFQNAIKLINFASKAGADAIKFQTFKSHLFLDKKHPKYEMYKSFELTEKEFERLSDYSKSKKIEFFSTPLDIPSAIFLNSIQKKFKIASGDINFYPLISKVASFKKKLIISTGASQLSEIKDAVKVIKNKWKNSFSEKNLSILHCISEYPAELNNINLNTINFLKNIFPNQAIGFSDHTHGLDASIYARCAGAEIIEKHFTLDNNFSKFRDHKLSLNPKNFALLVKKIHYLDKVFGEKRKKMQLNEKKNLKSLRRKIYIISNLKTSYKIKANDILYIRSNMGVFSNFKSKIIGKKIKAPIKKGFLKAKDIKKI